MARFAGGPDCDHEASERASISIERCMDPSPKGRRNRPSAETTARMKAVRQRDTAPELAVRRLVHGLGVRYRVCPRDLPGRPDLVNKSKGWCIFVHGCFWHGHEGCVLARLPRTNTKWWQEKITANKARDARKEEAMRALGFRVEVVWQCELADEPRLLVRLGTLVDQRP